MTPLCAATPSIRTTLGEKTQGVGATSSWTGDSSAGSLVVTSSSPEAGIEYDCSFDGQRGAECAIQYQESPVGTVVTWSMTGETGPNPVGRYFAYFAMEGMVGGYFEDGLQRLKKVVEESAAGSVAAGATAKE